MSEATPEPTQVVTVQPAPAPTTSESTTKPEDEGKPSVGLIIATVSVGIVVLGLAIGLPFALGVGGDGSSTDPQRNSKELMIVQLEPLPQANESSESSYTGMPPVLVAVVSLLVLAALGVVFFLVSKYKLNRAL